MKKYASFLFILLVFTSAIVQAKDSHKALAFALEANTKNHALNDFNTSMNSEFLLNDSLLRFEKIEVNQGDSSGFVRLLVTILGTATGGYVDFGEGTLDSIPAFSRGTLVFSHWYEQAGEQNVQIVIWNDYMADLAIRQFKTHSRQCYISNPLSPIYITVFSDSSGRQHFSSSLDINPRKFPDSFNALVYHWEFGDGSYLHSTAQSAVHAYASNGVYPVKLRVQDSLGLCNFQSDTNLIIWNSKQNKSCPTEFSSVAISSGNYQFIPSDTTLSAYAWHFGDGHISSSKYPKHQYRQSKNHTVQLITYRDDIGCANRTLKNVSIIVSCNVFYTSTVLDPFTVQFKRMVLSTAYTSTVWDFGDGSFGTSETDTITHRYAKPGSYQVKAQGKNPANNELNPQCSYTGTLNLNNCGYKSLIDKRIEGKVLFDDSLKQDYTLLQLYLVAFDSLLNRYSTVDSVYCGVKDSATFRFNVTCFPGPLYVKALCRPNTKYFSSFMPTYSDGKTLWIESAPLGSWSYDKHIVINMARLKPTIGSGKISGFISTGPFSNGKKASGIQVNLYTLQDIPVNYTYSNSDGYYEFSNLADGQYKVVVDLPGKHCTTHYVTLNSIKRVTGDINFDIYPDHIDVLNSAEPTSSWCRAYPNPTHDKIRIESINAASINVLRVIDMQGKNYALELSRLSPDLIELDFSFLKKGVYVVEVGNDQVISRVRILKH